MKRYRLGQQVFWLRPELGPLHPGCRAFPARVLANVEPGDEVVCILREDRGVNQWIDFAEVGDIFEDFEAAAKICDDRNDREFKKWKGNNYENLS